MVTIYGIKNCDTMKKAFKYLDEKGIAYTFHDYRVDGIDEVLIDQFLAQFPLKELVNKRSTTYRNLSDEEKATIDEVAVVKAIMLREPTLIKRPVLLKTAGDSDENQKGLVGFKAADYDAFFAR